MRRLPERRPDLFIIGAPKCGTTSLYEWLKGHHDVFMSPRKEPRFFAPDLLSPVQGKNLSYPGDMDRYLGLFAGARDEKRVGEASVQYLYSSVAPRLILDFQAKPYIVVMLRDPIEMMYSLHAQHVSGGTQPIVEFEQALDAEDERRQGIGVQGVNPRVMLYTERARFGEQLSRWFDAFPSERIHVIILDDLARDPSMTLRGLLEFLDVDPDYPPDTFPARNTRHQPRSRFLRSLVRSRLQRFIMWRLVPAVLGEGRSQALLGRVRGINRKDAARVPVRSAVRERLQAELADDLALASQLLGRDLIKLWWSDYREPAPAPIEAVGSAPTT